MEEYNWLDDPVVQGLPPNESRDEQDDDDDDDYELVHVPADESKVSSTAVVGNDSMVTDE